VSTVYATQTIHSASTQTAQRRHASRTAPGRSAAPTSDDIGFELFRRAILLRDEAAWLEISLRYRPMFISWAAQVNAKGATDEQCDDIADRAFARAWAALSPERFAQFPNLPALLGYLRACVSATTIDTARSQGARDRAYQRLTAEPIGTPEDLVCEQLERAELWQTALDAVDCPQERMVLLDSFLHELPPRDILVRHPDLFDSIHAVYMAKRHLLNRLQRSAALREYFDGVEV
jgi:hypothetical protein